jgi:hypothetical protein
MNHKRQHFLKFTLAIVAVLFISFFLVPAPGSPSKDSGPRILFVGNSLTFMNDLPRIIAELAQARNIHLDYDIYAPGGYRLSQHAADPGLLKKIDQGDWDFVVLQEQSQLPGLSQEQVQTDVYPFAQKLSQLIKKANPKTQVAFYMTMAKRNGDSQNAAAFPELGTYEGAQDRINASYVHMAQENQGLLVPVGLVWENVRKNEPSLGLYADDTHPNLTGSYLAACVFYAVLFNDNPIGLPHPPQIEDKISFLLQTIVNETILSFKSTSMQSPSS